MVALLAMFLAAPEAHALGVGTSVGLGTGDFASGGLFLPSLDLHFEPFVLQIHAMEFLNSVADDDLFIGANLYGEAMSADFKGPWKGTVQPGAGLDLFIDPTVLRITGEVRVGAQTSSGDGGFGVYVVPALGILVGDNDVIDDPFVAGGALQISAWFGS